MSTDPRSSILIAVKADNAFLRECLEHCGRLRDQDFEIVVLPDEPCRLDYPRTRVVPTGPQGPSEKRDRGLAAARGNILAFLDDDAYPDPGWLSAAVEALAQPDVAAVGGPAVTPPGDGEREQASGLVYASWLVAGPFAYRYVPRGRRDVEDYPTCNLVVKREALQRVGGFDTCYWPGEDTVVCLKIIRDLRQRIVYDPKVLVYHHRRSLFRGHLRQVTSYATHRGYFVKRFPKTSLKASYFFPSLWLAGMSLGWLPALRWNPWLGWWAAGVGVYLLLACAGACRAKTWRLRFLVLGGIIATHAAYGWFFLRGLLAGRLGEETAGRK